MPWRWRLRGRSRTIEILLKFTGRALFLLTLLGVVACEFQEFDSASRQMMKRSALASVPSNGTVIIFGYDISGKSCDTFDGTHKIHSCWKLVSRFDDMTLRNVEFPISEMGRSNLLYALEAENWIVIQEPLYLNSSVIGIIDEKLLENISSKLGSGQLMLSIHLYTVEDSSVARWRNGDGGCSPQVSVAVNTTPTEIGRIYDEFRNDTLDEFKVCFGRWENRITVGGVTARGL